ncbi:hypothetical protein SFRURICE_018211 [Spodoptera frugiperda]|nr:hypothetical protein SFRURICE_018211 [Spodoptera frugiperda]
MTQNCIAYTNVYVMDKRFYAHYYGIPTQWYPMGQHFLTQNAPYWVQLLEHTRATNSELENSRSTHHCPSSASPLPSPFLLNIFKVLPSVRSEKNLCLNSKPYPSAAQSKPVSTSYISLSFIFNRFNNHSSELLTADSLHK